VLKEWTAFHSKVQGLEVMVLGLEVMVLGLEVMVLGMEVMVLGMEVMVQGLEVLVKEEWMNYLQQDKEVGAQLGCWDSQPPRSHLVTAAGRLLRVAQMLDWVGLRF